MITFLVLGVAVVLAIITAAVIFILSNRSKKTVPSPGSRQQEPARARAHGEGDN